MFKKNLFFKRLSLLIIMYMFATLLLTNVNGFVALDAIKRTDIPQIVYNAVPPSTSPNSDYYVNLEGISIIYKGITYWIFDNRMNPLPGLMLIGAYDKDKKLLGTCKVVGARYLDKVTVEINSKTVTFYGQGTSGITWDELASLGNALVPSKDTNIPQHVYDAVPPPTSPSSDYYVNSRGISIMYKGIRYWIFDNRMNPWPGVMMIGAYDKNNNLLETCEVEGARYLEKVTVETDLKTVTFYGQGTSSITWDNLARLGNNLVPNPTPTPNNDTNIPQVVFNAVPPTSPHSDYYVNRKKISIMYKGIRYWIFDNRMNPWPGVMMIGAYDKNNNLLGTCEVEGARYLEKVTVETDLKTLTFYGQGTSNISWDALPMPKTRLGDLNGDNSINSTDVLILKKFVLGISDLPVDCELWTSDLNGDGMVDCIDIALLKRFILGAITEFPQ